MKATVVITGGDRGIGAATAVEFAKYGWTVVITYRSNRTDAARVVEGCKSYNVSSSALQLDVTDDEGIRTVGLELARRGGADVLVLNAGVIVWKPFREQSFAEVELQIRTNVEGLIKTTLALFPYIRSRLVIIGSDVAIRPHSGLVVYSASKAAARMFGLAIAGLSDGPQVVCVNPDRTATAMNNFQGRDPSEVASVIFQAATDTTLANGSEINLGTEPPATT